MRMNYYETNSSNSSDDDGDYQCTKLKEIR